MNSIVDTFNAKWLSADSVGRRFVPPARKALDDLLIAIPSIVVGPRGSGKTTLLKMLQAPALLSWEHPDAISVRTRAKYFSTFVPMDDSWGKQFEALGDGGCLSDANRKLLRTSAFGCHVLISMIEGVEDLLLHRERVHSEIGINLDAFDRKTESVFVESVAKRLGISPAISSLLGLKIALWDRSAEIFELASKSARTGDLSWLEKNWVHAGVLDNYSFCASLFANLSGNRGLPWYLLVDELEICPKEIRDLLMATIRGGKSNVILKLSLVPYWKDLEILAKPEEGKESNDYNVIMLYYSQKNEALRFSTELLSYVFSRRGISPSDAITVLGKTFMSEEESDSAEDDSTVVFHSDPDQFHYKNGRVGRKFASLEDKDESFRKFLKRRGIELSRMHEYGDKDRANLLRKIAPVVPIRDAFLQYFRGGQARINRIRKREIYSGLRSIAAIFEGNPRWLINYGTELAKLVSAGTIDPDRQSRVIMAAATTFRAYLRSLPYRPDIGVEKTTGLLSFVHGIGRNARRWFLTEEFDAQFGVSFVVDAKSLTAQIEEALGQAVNEGAIIFAPVDAMDKLLPQAKGKRFRLCYLLAAYYQLPLSMGGRAHKLSDLLTGEMPSLFSDASATDVEADDDLN